MDDYPVSITFRDVTYKRNPNAKQRSHRVYYSAPRGSGRGLLHRDLWESVNGPIRPGSHIHHVDGNPLNNDIANLAAVTPNEHAQEHAEEFREARRAHFDAIRPLAAEWHRSTEGRAWHSEHARRAWEQREPRLFECVECGVLFETTDARPVVRYCSRRCHRRQADRARTYERLATCPICGQEFWQSKYRAKPETCSRSCGAYLRARRAG